MLAKVCEHKNEMKMNSEALKASPGMVTPYSYSSCGQLEGITHTHTHVQCCCWPEMPAASIECKRGKQPSSSICWQRTPGEDEDEEEEYDDFIVMWPGVSCTTGWVSSWNHHRRTHFAFPFLVCPA